jgi:nucleotide-binding universal stress UspA family protein
MRMVRSILVGLDGSPFSRGAVELAVGWARQSDALIVGLGVIDEPTICQSEMVPIGASAYKQRSDEARLARATRQVEQILEQFSLRCANAGVASKVLEPVGDPAEQILREAQRYDLILLGRQTHFHFATQDEPCDTLHRVLRNTPRPVVAVPDQVLGGKSALVAYDGSLQATRALQLFQGVMGGGWETVHVLSIGNDKVEAARVADKAVEFLRFHDVAATPHAVAAAGPPYRVILDQARHLNAGLIVMGAYGQSTLREFFLGSVTQSLLKESPVPLFLYH